MVRRRGLRRRMRQFQTHLLRNSYRDQVPHKVSIMPYLLNRVFLILSRVCYKDFSPILKAKKYNFKPKGHVHPAEHVASLSPCQI